MTRKLPFTVQNVVRSFSEVTGLSPDKLSVRDVIGRTTKFCEVIVEGPALGDQYFTGGVTVYRDQDALDDCSVGDLERDEFDEVSDVGDLSLEDIVRHASKGCRLSDLRHWIIAEGRGQCLTDAEIKDRLKRPLETLVEHYREHDMEGAFSTLLQQCRYDDAKIERHLIRAAGGSQKIWRDELYEELPGGFIAHIISSEDMMLFRRLTGTAEKRCEG